MGNINDIPILDSSNIVQKIIEGEIIPELKYIVNNRSINLLYYLFDYMICIYPVWVIFVNIIAQPSNKKENHLFHPNKAILKEFGRAIGGLMSRWYIFSNPCMFWNRKFMKSTMKEWIILHNMIVEIHRDVDAYER